MNASHLQYSNVTEKVIGCAMKVHTYFGSGFPETVYKRSLIVEFEKVGLKFQSEVERDIYYQSRLIGKRRLDLLWKKRF